MNNKTLIGLVSVIAVVGGIFGAWVMKAPLTGGDFPGGVATTNLVTGSASGGISGNGYVQPAGSLGLSAANGLSVGTADQYHGLTEYATASGTPASVVTLGALGTATSTATSSILIPESQGLAVGAICSGSTATTTVFVSGCILTSTDNVTGTAIVYYSNGTGAALAVPTSTRLNITFDELPY